MADPVFVRDSFVLGKWYAFVPADKSGRYWTRYDFSVPLQNMTTYSKYFCIQQIVVGKVFVGQVVNPYRDVTGKWVENYPWSNVATGAWSSGRGTTTAGRYATVSIPATHNRIKLINDHNTGLGTIQIGWDTAATWADAAKDGLDVTEMNLADTTARMTETLIATNAIPGGRKLRIWKKGDDGLVSNCYGVRSWDTRVAGDPSTASSGIAVGHDFIDSVANCGTSSKLDIRNADIDCVVLTEATRAHEFAMSNGPAGGTRDFTGGSAHFNVSDYAYEYGAGTFTNGPMILLGNSETDMGAVYDSTPNPLGKVHSSSKIHIRSIGFPKWGSGNPPQIVWQIDIDGSGVSNNFALVAVDAVDFTYNQCFAAMFPLKSGLSAYFKTPNSDTKYDILAATDWMIPDANVAEIYIPAHNIKAKIMAFGSTRQILQDSSIDKVYCELWAGGWGTTKSGSVFQMGAGGVAAFGCRHEVEFVDPAFNSGWNRTRYGNPVN